MLGPSSGPESLSEARKELISANPSLAGAVGHRLTLPVEEFCKEGFANKLKWSELLDI